MSTVELRFRPGDWATDGGRRSEKRARTFRSLLGPAAVNTGQDRRSQAAGKQRKGVLAGLAASFARIVGWSLGGLCGVLLLGAVSLGLIHGYRALTSLEHFAVTSVEVSGNRQLSTAEILNLSGIVVGGSILKVSLAEVNSRILRSPWVESVTVRRVLPGGVFIRVEEREPFFWIQQAGVLYYADRFAAPIVPVELGRFVSLPTLLVEEGARPDRSAMQDWMRAVERMEYPFGFQEIAWLKVEEANLVRVFLEDRGMEVSMDLGAWREHGRLLNRVWEDLRVRGELERVARITVMSGKVWVQIRQS